MDTLAGNTSFPRSVVRMGNMNSAASWTERLDRDGPWRDARPPPPRGRRDRPRPHGSPAGGLPRATIHLRGVVGTIEPVEHNPQAVQRPRVAGLELDGALVRGQRAVELVHMVERLAEIKPRRRPAGVKLRCAPQVRHCVAPQPAAREQYAEARERLA